jgi:copper chaperone
MSKAIISLETLSCPSCLQKIENAVKRLNGVEKDTVKVLFNSSKVRTDFNESEVTIEDIEKAIESLGYAVIKSKVKSA